ncbi:MAG: GMC family oxidoreductase [Proteobacteria bacterium]|nr:GMC family oxidoreductase [Pseudomonadota bacterium]
MIRDCATTAPATSTRVDTVIIGSGCAGGTTAWVLAEAGREVLIIEEGPDKTGAQLTQRDGEMYDQLYMDRGGRMTTDLSVGILQGRVLGGGGVINASDVVPLEDPVLDLWGRRFGLVDWTAEALRAARARALVDLSANPIREDQVTRNNQVLREGSTKLGYAGHVMRHNRVGCAGMGTCLIGCPIDAKKNPRMVAIPAAVEAGATVWTRARVVRIEDADQDTKRLVVRTLDAKGYHETGEVEVLASTVVLAANAVGSAALLVRSGIGNAHVGRHLSLQPQLPVLADFPDPIHGFRGIPQAYAVDEAEYFDDERGLWGFRIESIMGTPGIVASLLPYAGVRAKNEMTRYPHLAAALLLTPDTPSGSIDVTQSGRILVDYTPSKDVIDRYRDAIKMAARSYLAAGATRVAVPTLPPIVIESEADLAKVDAYPFRPASAPLISAHQQGGVRAAPNASDGAANPEGLVYGTRSVYCFDSGLYPSSSSSHTMAPILATSRWLAEALLTR